MDIDPDRIKKHIDEGIRVVSGDVQDIDMWEKIELNRLNGIKLTMSGDIEQKRHALQTIGKSPCNASINVLALNDAEEEIIREENGVPVSMSSFEMGKKWQSLV